MRWARPSVGAPSGGSTCAPRPPASGAGAENGPAHRNLRGRGATMPTLTPQACEASHDVHFPCNFSCFHRFYRSAAKVLMANDIKRGQKLPVPPGEPVFVFIESRP